MKTRTILKELRLFAVLLGCVLLVFRVQADAGFALRFDGTNSYVTIQHNAALNAYPLTITAWVKTLRNTSLVDGIVSKYADASGNGYSINLRNGNLYAWYLRSGGSVVVNPLGLDGGPIADGHWHHIAFVISTTSGQLYVDGNLRNSVNWTGIPGPPTGTEPLQFGRYYNYGNAFQGEMDEVALWNRALSAGEVNYLKHRRLSGTEDGLLGYWRFDEGSGTAANNTATNRFHGTLLNAPGRVESHAAIALEPIAASGIKLDGVDDFVTVTHNVDLNSYPFTASTWFRTTDGNSVRGLVTKSVDTGNGWSLIVQGGRLRGFYYRSFSNFAVDTTSAASVSDGAWHHAALVVDASGGKLFLDGILVGSSAWTGPAGGVTLPDPLQIGRYFNYTTPLMGAIDEVTVWNGALTASEIQLMKNLPLAGSESGLVAYWRFDDATGTAAIDSSGLGHTGTLTNGAAWTGSTAYLGDGSVHLVAAPSIPSFTRQYAINTAVGLSLGLGQNTFTVTGRGFLRRFHDFGIPPPSVALVTRLDGGLQIAGAGTPIPVKPNIATNSFSMSAYNASTPQPLFFGGVASLSSTIYIQPDGVQLDSVNNLHEGTVTLSHTENGGAVLTDGFEVTEGARLLHFNGTILFGPLATVITSVANTPTAGSLFAPSYVQSTIQLSANGGYVAAYPMVRFGGGAAFTVNLGTDGTATNVNGTFSLSAAGQFFESAGIRYQLPGATLGPAGMTATSLLAWFPTGFGMTTSTNNRAMLPYASKANIVLDGNLLPNTDNLVFTAASYNTSRLYFSEETKPLLIGATQIEWHVPQGEFYISQADSVQFVREQDDADLSAQSANLVNPLAADRVSNDGYYRHVTTAPGVPIYVRPNANGAASLTMQATLQENEFRPHFPYMNRNIGGHIPVVGGTLIINNDLIDGMSRLLLAGPVPVPYARDCAADSCSGAATNGP